VDLFQLTAKSLLDVTLAGNGLASGTDTALPELAKSKSCSVSCALLERFHNVMLRDYTPLDVTGDGNCLFRAVSLGLYGTEECHKELRAKAAIEIAMHQEWYDKSSENFCAPFKDDPFIVLPTYSELCTQVGKNGTHVGILCALALSAVCGCKLQLYFPPVSPSFTAHPLTQCVTGRNVDQRGVARLTVMWTATLLPSDVTVDGVNINHFVPLLRFTSTSTGVNVCVSDSESECEPCVSVNEPSLSCDDSPVVDHDVIVSDVCRVRFGGDGDECDDRRVDAPPSGSDDADDDDFEHHKSKKVKVDNGKEECIVPTASGNSGSFKPNEEVFHLLRECTPEDVLSEVPRGKKVNCCFMVNNTDNMQRKSMQQCNRFWDDCGAWDREKGRNLTSTFVLSTSGAGTSADGKSPKR